MSATLDRKLQQAAAALAEGDLARAEQLSREVLERAPRHPRALQLAAAVRLQREDGAGAGELLQRALASDPHNPDLLEGLGAAALKAGNFVEAESWLRRALALGGGGGAGLSWLGLALSSQGRRAEAVEIFRRAAVAGPEDPGVHLNLGHELMKIGEWNDAETSYRRAIRLRPDYPEAHNSLGSVLKILRKLDGALACFQQAIMLRPDYAQAYDSLGDVLLRLGRKEEAASCFRRAIALDPDNADFHADLGNVLLEQQLWDDAVASYERALALRPDYPEALYSLGSALRARGSPDASIAPLRRAIALRPDYAEAHDNLGNTLVRVGREDEADACFRRAIMLQPDQADRYLRYGNALLEQCRVDEASAQFERALEMDPACTDAQYGLAGVQLMRQQFEQAWPNYEQRFKNAEYRKTSFSADTTIIDVYELLAHWQGPGEKDVEEVAIWAEQGLGDQVMLSSLIPDLIAAGTPILYEVDHRMKQAYERAFPGVRFVTRRAPPQEVLQRASRVLSIGSLPALFRRSREDFSRQPAKLLHAIPERVAHYRQRLEAAGPGLKVALSWRSTRKGYWGAKKSAPLADFAPLLELPGVRFVDVQYGDTTVERNATEAAIGVRLLRFEEVDYFMDLEEVLAILEACDLLVTTSNATAHFAGALGKRTWLLYLADRPPFHYWAHGGSYRCLWYPSVEIVTAPHLKDWASLIEHVRERLGRELAQVGPGHDGSPPAASGS